MSPVAVPARTDSETANGPFNRFMAMICVKMFTQIASAEKAAYRAAIFSIQRPRRLKSGSGI